MNKNEQTESQPSHVYMQTPDGKEIDVTTLHPQGQEKDGYISPAKKEADKSASKEVTDGEDG